MSRDFITKNGWTLYPSREWVPSGTKEVKDYKGNPKTVTVWASQSSSVNYAKLNQRIFGS